MPRLEIKTIGTSPDKLHNTYNELILDVPDKTGNYRTKTGRMFRLVMNPHVVRSPQSAVAIVPLDDLTPLFGKKILVFVGKEGTGSTDLSPTEQLVVKLNGTKLPPRPTLSTWS